MHENTIYYALQRELRRLFPDWAETAVGRAKVDDMILNLMRVIKEEGLDYVNAKERAQINTNRT